MPLVLIDLLQAFWLSLKLRKLVLRLHDLVLRTRSASVDHALVHIRVHGHVQKVVLVILVLLPVGLVALNGWRHLVVHVSRQLELARSLVRVERLRDPLLALVTLQLVAS